MLGEGEPRGRGLPNGIMEDSVVALKKASSGALFRIEASSMDSIKRELEGIVGTSWGETGGDTLEPSELGGMESMFGES